MWVRTNVMPDRCHKVVALRYGLIKPVTKPMLHHWTDEFEQSMLEWMHAAPKKPKLELKYIYQ